MFDPSFSASARSPAATPERSEEEAEDERRQREISEFVLGATTLSELQLFALGKTQNQNAGFFSGTASVHSDLRE